MSGIKGTKSDSGAAKRKRQKLAEVFAKSQEGSLFKHFARPGCGVTVSNEVNRTSDSESSQTLHSSCLSSTSSASCSYSNVNILTEHEETRTVMQPEQVSLFTYVNECACELYMTITIAHFLHILLQLMLYANSVCVQCQ